MAPSIVGTGAVASGTTAITPAFPAGVAADDIILTVAECEGVTAPGAYTLPSGWAHIASDSTPVSPVLQGTNTRLWVIWARYDGVMTAPSLGDSGDHNVGRTIAIRGCPTTGNPWHIVAVATSATSSTAASFPGVTTTVPDTLVLEIISTGTDTSTGQLSTITNANYTSITSQMNNWVISGNGGGFAVLSAVMANAGATGQSTGTLAAANTKAYMTLAFAAATGSGGVFENKLQRSPRPVEQGSPAGPYAVQAPTTILPGG